jgi:methylglyoxal synthase
MSTKRVALIAHVNKKKELIEWVKFNLESMRKCEIYATGTTGKQLEKELDLTVKRLQSRPLGGDQQIGALIAKDDRCVNNFLGSFGATASRPGH